MSKHKKGRDKAKAAAADAAPAESAPTAAPPVQSTSALTPAGAAAYDDGPEQPIGAPIAHTVSPWRAVS